MRYALPSKLFVITLLVVGGFGCQHVKTPVIAFNDDGSYLGYRGGKGLVAKSDSPIPDVPMPVGFKAVVSRSSSTFDGMVRTVNHTYQGRGGYGDTVEFYRGQLPLHRWQLVSRVDQPDASTSMTYTKGREQLEVYVRQGTLLDRFDSSVTTIVVNISGR